MRAYMKLTVGVEFEDNGTDVVADQAFDALNELTMGMDAEVWDAELIEIEEDE